MAENAPELTNHELEEYIQEGVVLIDFFADWCMPCMMMTPIVEDLAEELAGKIKVCKVNVADDEAVAQKYNINSIPNFTILKDGKVIEQMTGSMSLDELKEKVEAYL